MKLVIINYGAGNTQSVKFSFERLELRKCRKNYWNSAVFRVIKHSESVFGFSPEIIKERVMFDEMELTDFLVNALDLKIFSRCRFKTTNSKYATAFGLAGFLFREKERTL